MSTLWAVSFLTPVATVFALGLVGLAPDPATERWRRRLVLLAPATVLPALALAFAGPAAGAVQIPWLLLGTMLEVDPVGRPLLLVAAILYGVAAVAVATVGTARAPALMSFLLVSFVGNIGLLVAADAVTFYLAFAVMSFAGFGLVVHERTDFARRAGRIYLVLAVISETFILGGLILVAAAGGRVLADAPAAVAASESTGLIVAVLLVGFGVKAGTVPLHVWLPLAHPAAPPAASAVLSGCMIKAGIVGWIRFLPLGEEAQPGWGLLLVVLALLGAFLAVPAGVLQGDAKVALAYSSISQMGFLAALVGVALAAPELADAAIVAAVLYAAHHGLAKGALFLGIPLWRRYGSGVIRWWIVGALLGAALAVAGAPFSSGSVAKYAAKGAVGEASLLGVDLVSLLPLVATGSTILLARFAFLLLSGPRQQPHRVDAPLVSWSVLVVAGISLTWILAGEWFPVTTVPDLEPVTLWDASWPILLGVAISAVAWWLSHHERLPGWAAHPDGRFLPPGDLVVPEEALILRVRWALERGAARGFAVRSALIDILAAGVRRLGATGSVLRGAEQQLRVWEVSGVVTLGLLLVLLGAGVVR
ncbi:proton-conducting transporter transmembrane domain-containing protein [Nocardioides limicola]|uniref:proton-conducting transporter transmembrane domain-containing protein n=1 Tax=Nocardioides limicola TaxID=2803368 RepID=UPI00193C811F|nr:proton-conducting transporter membrane subunit [Nocardioides sp. DJM-14]